MSKRAISKNYFHWDPSEDGKIYDQRVINKLSDPKKEAINFGLNPNEINTKILVYEDRVKEWFLEVGKRLKSDNEAGFIILQITLSYIEGNQQYREGESSERKSKEFFREGLKRIFPGIQRIYNIENVLDDFYKKVRCGLFHTGITGYNVSISGDYPDALKILFPDFPEIYINPPMFLDSIISDFENYIKELKDSDNINLRENFEKFYDRTG